MSNKELIASAKEDHLEQVKILVEQGYTLEMIILFFKIVETNSINQ